MFNALNYVKKLSDGGFSKEQASNSLQVWIEVMNEGFISKHEFEKFDISIRGHIDFQTSELRGYIDLKIADLRGELKQDISDLRAELKQEIADLKTDFTHALHKQTILMGSMFALSTTLTTTILGFLLKA